MASIPSDFIGTLKSRFESTKKWHSGLKWDDVEKRLTPSALKVLWSMEETGGEPNLIRVEEDGKFLFADCSLQTPSGRRSLCYDKKALDGRKNHPPAGDAISMAAEKGSSMMDEDIYRYLQQLLPVDTKTSSWIETPREIRDLGGALFGDRRYDQVFIYHNGADSYYAARGFRTVFAI